MKHLLPTLLVSSLALLGGCVSAPAPSHITPAPTADWVQEQVPAGRRQVVLFRDPTDTVGAVNVFLADRYHSSLLPGGYSVVNLCTGDQRVRLSTLDSLVRASAATAAQVLALNAPTSAGQQQFYKVQIAADGQVGAVLVQPSQADRQRYVYDSITIDRSLAECAPVIAAVAPVAPVAPPQVVPVTPLLQSAVKRLSLALGSGFSFGSFDLKQSSEAWQVREQLVKFATEHGFKQVSRVTVVGHSDPIGAPHRKELIAGERAKAVAAWLVQNGIPADKIQVSSASDSQLMVANCPTRPVKLRDECNAPNRRVEIEMSGLK